MDMLPVMNFMPTGFLYDYQRDEKSPGKKGVEDVLRKGTHDIRKWEQVAKPLNFVLFVFRTYMPGFVFRTVLIFIHPFRKTVERMIEAPR